MSIEAAIKKFGDQIGRFECKRTTEIDDRGLAMNEVVGRIDFASKAIGEQAVKARVEMVRNLISEELPQAGFIRISTRFIELPFQHALRFRLLDEQVEQGQL